MYECPNCSGNLKFDIPSQKLLCEHCGTMMNPYDFQKERDAEETTVGEDEYEVTVFTCPQCGGELISNDTTAATFCSFCGGSAILDSRISKEKRPQYIIPFQKTKEDCRKAYAKMMRRAFFAPSELKEEKHISRFRSIYMPYWVYRFEKSEHVSFRGSRSHRSGDYIITDHFKLESDVEAKYKGLTFDAASSFSDNLSNAIAPFEWRGAQLFTPSFLSGFYADTEDVAAWVYQEDAENIVTQELCSQMERDPVCKKYNLGSDFTRAMAPRTVQKELAMLPVWFLTYRKKDRVSYTVVNGQTGKAAGDIPVDSFKYLLGSLLLAIPLFLLLNLLVSMRASTMLLAAGILAAVCCFISVRQKQDLQARETGEDDKGKGCSGSPGESGRIKVTLGKTSTIALICVFCILGGSFLMFLPAGDGGASMTKLMVPVVLYIAVIVICSILEVKKKKGQRIVRQKVKRPRLKARDFLKSVSKPGAGILLALIVLIVNPVSDLYYYGAALAAMGLICWDILGMIERFNLLATRELPQFHRRGGEEDGR